MVVFVLYLVTLIKSNIRIEVRILSQTGSNTEHVRVFFILFVLGRHFLEDGFGVK